MIDLGIVRPGSTLRIPFTSFDKDDGSAVTMTNFAAADILIYKDGSTTERASTAGFTATTDFDGKTGKHLAIIDLSDNTTSGFYNAGSEYLVAIDSVTIDGVTTGGWVARFRIGHPAEWFSTTIASLTSQTSFTLTSGPAEDDALNGHWCIIHDVASAVQCGKALISDYVGSTKTVTLAAGTTFTAAAGDNISIMDQAPLQPATLGRTLVVDAAGLADANTVKLGPTGSGTAQTARDIGASVLISSGTGSGQLSVASGVIAANVTQFGGSNGTFASGRPEVNTSHIAGSAVSTSSAQIGVNVVNAAGTAWNSGSIGASTLATDTITAAKVAADAVTEIQSGLSTLDAAGVRSAIGLASANLDTQLDALPTAAENADAVWDEAIAGHSGVGSAGEALQNAGAAGTPPSAADIADAVWDEALSGHSTTGSAGAGLSAASSAGDPWATSLPGAYGSGTAGKIIGDNLNATISSRASSSALATAQADLDTLTGSDGVTLATSQPNYAPLKPTTSGRTLDVTATGEAGIDWGNIGSPTATVNLSGTTIKTATDVETDTAEIGAAGAGLTALASATNLAALSTKVGTPAGASVSADIAAVKSDTAAILTDTGTTLDAALAVVDANVDAIKAVTDQITFSTGAVDANVARVNDVAIDGTGTGGDPWGPA
jgi:hypothetical protein